MPIHLSFVRHSVPLPEIEVRLGDAITTERKNGRRVAGQWEANSAGIDIEDATIASNHSIRYTALEIVEWPGWHRLPKGRSVNSRCPDAAANQMPLSQI